MINPCLLGKHLPFIKELKKKQLIRFQGQRLKLESSNLSSRAAVSDPWGQGQK